MGSAELQQQKNNVRTSGLNISMKMIKYILITSKLQKTTSLEVYLSILTWLIGVAMFSLAVDNLL